VVSRRHRFDTFNLGDHVGDDPSRGGRQTAPGWPARSAWPDRVVWMNQVHGDRVEVVDKPQSAAVGGGVGTDALVTSTPLLALGGGDGRLRAGADGRRPRAG